VNSIAVRGVRQADIAAARGVLLAIIANLARDDELADLVDDRLVEVGLGAARKSSTARARAERALSEVGLQDRRDEWPAVLSGGQKQRVALARALVSHPRVLALDEPLGALDALTRISMQSLLGQVWSDQNFTAILVTHDVAEALALADRLLVVDEGRIALDLDVGLARPRRRGSAELAALEGKILQHLLSNSGDGPDA